MSPAVTACDKCNNTGIIVTNHLEPQTGWRYCTSCFRGEAVKHHRSGENPESVDLTDQPKIKGLRYVSPEDQKRVAEKLVGLPFVVLSLAPAHATRVCGELLNGTKVRADYVEQVWNAALLVDAIDGPGAWRATVATPEQLEVCALAERWFGSTLLDALPVWLSMPKTAYDRWEDRPAVLWPKPTVN